jgi:hypothetical protein
VVLRLPPAIRLSAAVASFTFIGGELQKCPLLRLTCGLAGDLDPRDLMLGWPTVRRVIAASASAMALGSMAN